MNTLMKIRRGAAIVTCATVAFFPLPLRADDPGPPEQSESHVVSFSLARDFSDAENTASRVWSYRMDDGSPAAPDFPLLGAAKRDANALWGSDFATPPLMWSEEVGYWGIGKNTSGEEQISTRNAVRWAPGEVLLHPRGSAPSATTGLVIAWTAPEPMQIDLNYTLGRASPHGNGIGYAIIHRTRAGDAPLVALQNIGFSLANELNGLSVAQGDQLLFRFHTDGEPTGDIVRVEIVIRGEPGTATTPAVMPVRATVTAGSDLRLTGPTTDAPSRQWLKNGQPIPGATGLTHQLPRVTASDAGRYSIASGAPSATATVAVTPRTQPPEPYASPVPRQVFPLSLAGQEAALANDPQMQRFAASRQRLSTDRYRPAYHFVSPESQLNDPNGLCFWQGRWHLFYQAYPPDEFPNPADFAQRRQHWGHAVSDDLIHWRDLPYALYPGIEKMCFSGGTVVEPDRVIAYYPGIAAGQMVAVASDPLLLNWEKLDSCPVQSPTGDSCIWKEGDTYFGLVGPDRLVSSTDLTHWSDLGPFIESNRFPHGDACPGFVPIGDKYLLATFSHSVGGQYLLGDYSPQDRKFKPYTHGRFNHGRVSPGGVHAPSVAADGTGGVINILNINDGENSKEWDQIMSLAQQLSLGPDHQLRISPVEAVKSLRANHQHISEITLPANQDIVLDSIKGHTMELIAEIDPQSSRWVQLNVLRSPGAEEQTSITFYNFDRKLSVWYETPGVISLDGTRSSTHPDTWIRPPEQATLQRSPGPLRLRVFLDRSVIEVFVNDTLYLAMRVYPDRSDSTGVSLRAQGREAVLKSLDAWTLKPSQL